MDRGRYEWVRPRAWKMDWELRRDGETVGTMSSPAFFGTSMRGTIEGEAYVMRRGGLRRPGAAINRMGEPDDLAVLSIDSLGGGEISIAGASELRWERPQQGEVWNVIEEGTGTLLTVRRDVRGRRPRGDVTIERDHRCLGPLLLLTWFMIFTTEP